MPQAGEAGGKARKLAALHRDGRDMGHAGKAAPKRQASTWALADTVANSRKLGLQ